MKQTAVEWLANEIQEQLKIFFPGATLYQPTIQKAKEMEKEWQTERMYSEEEVKRLAFDFYYDMSRQMGVAENLISENATNVDVWFEQFKKK